MAAATASTQPFDLSKPASFPIRLGSSLTSTPDAVDPYVNLRYNYKPQSLSQDASAHIKSLKSSQNKAIKLDIQDGQWSYDGRQAQDVGDNYVLILRGEGSKKEAVLERIHSGYEFNLTNTPDEADSEALRKQYPHLEDAGQVTDGDDLFGDEANDEEPLDPSNPFDYRHHLNTALADHNNKQNEPPPSSKPTPRSQPTRPASSTPLARPTHKRQASSNLFTQQPKKRKPPTSDAPTPSQPKEPSTKKPNPDSQQPKTSQTSSSSRTNKHPQSTPRQPPEIRLDRQASSVHQHTSSSSPHHHEAEEDEDPVSDESGGELILENDDNDNGAAQHSRRHHHQHNDQHQAATSKGKARNAGAMSLALSGQLGAAAEPGAAGGGRGGGGGGPISLRSAASSPASRIDSPGTFHTTSSASTRGLGRPQQQDGSRGAEGMEIDLGGDGDGEEQEGARDGEGGGAWGDGDGRGYEGGEEVDEVEDDADVEDLELPSPAADGTAGRRDGRGGEEEGGGVGVEQQQEEEEEEDDLDAQLAAAMAQDDGGGGGGQAEQFVQEEEEEESEEE
ncbi:hypothetical protein D0863_13613 [Hortaea werneckii]|uniref:Transcription elongation factor Eaf N-terminal domain-containing protein n=1 Tax=Hortaea werneckii TaxID=91943 RepID=A0A3M7CR65_HORWE|nr:hypothetical protein D0863_13613 [Hortaea werneckii]